MLSPAIRPQVSADFVRVIDPGDRDYFRRSRETQFGMTLEQFCSGRDAALPELSKVCAPVERTLSEQPFLAGDAPAYVDYIIFSVFQQARIGSPRDVLQLAPGMESTQAWRSRMVALHGGLGDRFAGYPTEDT
jgi:glutathione S-transferase